LQPALFSLKIHAAKQFAKWNEMLKYLVIHCFIFFAITAKADTIISFADGNWSDSATWTGGRLPGYSISDTVLIEHCVFYNQDIQVDSGGVLVIGDSGKICGHQIIHLLPGSELDIFGRIYFDTVFAEGEIILNTPWPSIGRLVRITYPGNIEILYEWKLRYYDFICSCSFDSVFSEPHDTAIASMSVEDTVRIDIGPNPFTGWLYIKAHALIDYFYLTDALGRIIMQRMYEENKINLGYLSPGVYFLNFKIADGTTITKKIVRSD
jgi:hypothetical protein